MGKTEPKKLDETVAGVLGQITWLMSQSSEHKTLFVTDLEWLVMPAIVLKQFKMFYKDKMPVGCILWGKVSDEVAARLEQPNFRLQVTDWQSGPNLKIINIIAPFGAKDELKAQFMAEITGKSDARALTGQA